MGHGGIVACGFLGVEWDYAWQEQASAEDCSAGIRYPCCMLPESGAVKCDDRFRESRSAQVLRFLKFCYTPSMDITFAALTAEDVQELEQWHQDAELAHRYGGAEWPRKLWEIIQKNAQRKCWVASLNCEQVGYVDFEMHPEEQLAWIGLAVKAEKRGQGLGKSILQEFLTTSIVQNFREIRAGIEHDNTASVRCFSSVGFIPLNTEPDEEGILDYSLKF